MWARCYTEKHWFARGPVLEHSAAARRSRAICAAGACLGRVEGGGQLLEVLRLGHLKFAVTSGLDHFRMPSEDDDDDDDDVVYASVS